jgi:Flp pilus assembly pilin Flp
MLRGIVSNLKRLHRDERGAEGLEKILIVCAVVLPLLGVLIYFRDEIMKWVKDLWEKARGASDTVDPSKPFG